MSDSRDCSVSLKSVLPMRVWKLICYCEGQSVLKQSAQKQICGWVDVVGYKLEVIIRQMGSQA